MLCQALAIQSWLDALEAGRPWTTDLKTPYWRPYPIFVNPADRAEMRPVYDDLHARYPEVFKGEPLFRTLSRQGQLTGQRLSARKALAMIKRRARAAELGDAVCCHTFRATGITDYLNNGGSLENAQAIAAHSSPRTTKLYDRTSDEISLDEIEKIQI